VRQSGRGLRFCVAFVQTLKGEAGRKAGRRELLLSADRGG
jgi:hypothetical protein